MTYNYLLISIKDGKKRENIAKKYGMFVLCFDLHFNYTD